MPCKYRFGFRWGAKSAADSRAHPVPQDFCGQASSAPFGFLVIPPFLAPLACWWILIVVLSSIRVVSSTSSCLIRAARISSHTLPFVHARNRLYTLCHGPSRSGKSRQGIPLFSQYRIALSSSRLLLPGRPPCGFFSGGNKSLILFHCFSLIFMFFHVLYFIISALYTQSLSFKTDFRACLKIVNTPKGRLFFRHTLPIFLGIHKVFLRQTGFVWRKNPSPPGIFPIFKQRLDKMAPRSTINGQRRHIAPGAFYQVNSKYRSLYCFAELSQDSSLSISRCTISSQHQRFSK